MKELKNRGGGGVLMIEMLEEGGVIMCCKGWRRVRSGGVEGDDGFVVDSCHEVTKYIRAPLGPLKCSWVWLVWKSNCRVVVFTCTVDEVHVNMDSVGTNKLAEEEDL